MFRNVLVAVDGSAGSRKAAAFARQLMTDPATKLTALLAIEPESAVLIGPFDTYVPRAQNPTPEGVAAAHALIDDLRAVLGAERVEVRVEVGRPAELICKIGDEIQADVIVVGARGLDPAERWLLGSVSEKVMRHAGRPVTVVR